MLCILSRQIPGETDNCFEPEASLRGRRSLPRPFDRGLGTDVSLAFIRAKSHKLTQILLHFIELESGSTADRKVRIQRLHHHRSTSGHG